MRLLNVFKYFSLSLMSIYCPLFKASVSIYVKLVFEWQFAMQWTLSFYWTSWFTIFHCDSLTLSHWIACTNTIKPILFVRIIALSMALTEFTSLSWWSSLFRVTHSDGRTATINRLGLKLCIIDCKSMPLSLHNTCAFLFCVWFCFH